MPPSVAVIAGSSQGIGLQLARGYLRRSGLQVVALSRRPDESRRAILEGLEEHKERLVSLEFDALREESIAEAARHVKDKHGEDSLRLLFNVAGVLHAEKNVAQVDQRVSLETFQINTIFPLLAFKHFFPLLPSRPSEELEDTCHGTVPAGYSVIASMTARVGSIEDNKRGGWYSYRASKAAQNQLTRTLAHEMNLRKKRAIALGLHPGTVIGTKLSEPFTSGREADPERGTFDADESASRLIDVIGGASAEQSGQAFDWAGKRIPW